MCIRDRATEALKKASLPEEAIRAGGRTLEKEITPATKPLYLRFLAAKAYHTFVMKRRDMKYVTSALQAAKPMLEADYEDLDSDPYLLNCPDGTYDLRLGMGGKRDHAALDLITKVTAVARCV